MDGSTISRVDSGEKESSEEGSVIIVEGENNEWQFSGFSVFAFIFSTTVSQYALGWSQGEIKMVRVWHYFNQFIHLKS